MREAIFLAVARHAEFEVGIGYLRRAASGATVERFVFAARLNLRNGSRRTATSLRCRELANHSRAKKDEIIAQAAIRAIR